MSCGSVSVVLMQLTPLVSLRSTNTWSPPHARYKNEKYRNQPLSITEYEPGFSSIAFKEARVVSTFSYFCKEARTTLQRYRARNASELSSQTTPASTQERRCYL